MAETRIRSSLAGITPSPTDTETIKADGWRNLGILVIDVNHKGLSDTQRAFIENLGNQIYGRRNGR